MHVLESSPESSDAPEGNILERVSGEETTSQSEMRELGGLGA